MYTAIIDYKHAGVIQQLTMNFNTYIECWHYINEKVESVRNMGCFILFAALFMNHEIILYYSIDAQDFIEL